MKNAKRLMTLKEVKEQVGDKRYKEMEDIYESIKRRTIPVLPQAIVMPALPDGLDEDSNSDNNFILGWKACYKAITGNEA